MVRGAPHQMVGPGPRGDLRAERGAPVLLPPPRGAPTGPDDPSSPGRRRTGAVRLRTAGRPGARAGRARPSTAGLTTALTRDTRRSATRPQAARSDRHRATA